jgi:hypothetical protein
MRQSSGSHTLFGATRGDKRCSMASVSREGDEASQFASREVTIGVQRRMKTSNDRANAMAAATAKLVERCAAEAAFSRFFAAIACASRTVLTTRGRVAGMRPC